jgi:hypothetical protein
MANPAFIQGVSGVSNIQNGTATVTGANFVTQNSAAGSLLVAEFEVNAQAATLNSITDNQGNTWVVLSPFSNGSTWDTYFCYALNTAGGSKPQLTLHFASAPASVYYALGEYSLVSSYRGASTALAIQFTQPSSTNAVTSVAGDLILGVYGAGANNTTAPTSSNSTVEETGGNGTIHQLAFSDAIAAGTSSTVAFSGWSSNVQGAIQALAFVPTPTAATPTFSPNGGSFGPAQTVTITSSTSGGTIYYTTDGSTPTHGSSSIANGATVSISSTCTLKAIESASGFQDSAVGSASFTINGAVATSTFSPVAGSYSSTQSVTVNNANSGLPGFAQYYTTDGSTPTTGSTLVSGAISVSSSETLKVLAVATNYSNSAIASAAYVINSGAGIGTVLTNGAAQPVTVANASGFSLPITSPTTSGKMGQPTPIVFCDINGNELTVTGSTKGAFIANPIPVVLCDHLGRPITPTLTFSSNGNSIVVTATKTGNKMGQPVPVVLTDPNGFAYLTADFAAFGTGSQNPTPICLTDINGNVLSLVVGN